MTAPTHHDERTPMHVPAENVLDLRHQERGPTHRAQRPRSDLLAAFWRRDERLPRRPRPSFRWPRIRLPVWPRLPFRIGAFPLIAVSLVIILGGVAAAGRLVSLRELVLSTANSGSAALRTASASAATRDFDAASAAFTDAAAMFAAANDEFHDLNPVLTAVIEHAPYIAPRVTSARHLMVAAQHLATAGSTFSAIAGPLPSNGEGFSEAATLLGNIERNRDRFQVVLAEIDRSVDELSDVRASVLPPPYREQVTQLQATLPALKSSVRSLDDGLAVAAELLGVGGAREELFLFQNANELRPTGGFMGSFALIRLDGGSFKILDAPHRGTLGVDDYLPSTIRPPLPLQVITPSWYFRDANWYPDFPTTAQQVVRFYRQARGFTPDGVLAVTNTFLERLLSLTGPVEVPGYDGVTVDAEHFSEVAQEQSQLKFDLRVNDPKRFIVDLIPVIAQRLGALDLGQYPALLATLVESIASGDLQFWSADPGTQTRIASLGWSGALPQPPGDFLELVDTNVGGGKTDAVIDEAIRQQLTVHDDGSVVATVEVTRTHHGTLGDPFTSDRNRTYHRLYTPLGSKLIAATGFTVMPPDVFRTIPDGSRDDPYFRSIEGRVSVDEETGTRINDEFGKTVFGNWTELDPGQTATWTLSYLLPFRVEDGLERYDLTIGKQAGANRRTFTVDVSVTPERQILWTSQPGASVNKSSLHFQTDLVRPASFSFVIRDQR